MKVFVTTDALTKGIQEVDVNLLKNGIAEENINLFPRRFGRKDFYENREDAVMRAESLRMKRIRFLKEKIEELENLKFE